MVKRYHPISIARFKKNNRNGFTLIELLVVLMITVILSVLAFQGYAYITVKQRDSQRKSDMQTFVTKLEAFKNDKGTYVCGDTCSHAYVGGVDAGWYSISCNGGYVSPGNATGNDLPLERSGFLNGGDCCGAGKGGFPIPTSTADDSTWGLYRFNYLTATSNPSDPLDAVVNAKNYYYCYATPNKGRTSYALFMRLENDSKTTANDGGQLPTYYEYYSPDYPANGWNPVKDGPGGIWAY